METSNAYARTLLEGIVKYIREHESWSIYLPEQQRGASPPSWLKNWKGDGLIVRIETAVIAKAIRRLHVPVVDLSAARLVPGIPWVETDDDQIASVALEHFLRRGFENVAFCGSPDFNWSTWREDAFTRRAREAGRNCHVFHSRSREVPGFSMTRERKRLAKWIGSLPRPTGVFACYDILAQLVLDVCREGNTRVPEDISVLGVDNDELLCSLCTPPLSSIIPDATRTGYEAAKLLDKLMHGQSITQEAFRISPLGIATRQSTDVMAIDDPEVAAAVRFIRDHASDGINVHDVLKHVPLSRRIMERRFRAIVGRTPHQEIVRRRLEKVKQLLHGTDLTLARIAERAGFQSEEYMSVAFRREMKMPPGQYRRG